MQAWCHMKGGYCGLRSPKHTVLDELLAKELAGVKLAPGASWLVSKPDRLRAQSVHLQSSHRACQSRTGTQRVLMKPSTQSAGAVQLKEASR